MGALRGEEIQTSSQDFKIIADGASPTTIFKTSGLGALTLGNGAALVINPPLNTTYGATIQTANQGQATTYTLPDAGGNASFVMTEGTQTINGQKTVGTGLTFSDNKHIALGATTGTYVGTNNTQKLGFYGKTPVIQAISAAGFTNASGGATNGDLVVQVNNVVAALRNLGLVAVA